MAQDTTVTAGSSKVNYYVIGSSLYIAVDTTTGLGTQIGYASSNSASLTVSDVVAELERTIRNNTSDIKYYKEQITELNTKLSDPNQQGAWGIYKEQIEKFQSSIPILEGQTQAAKDAIAEINANGTRILQDLFDKNQVLEQAKQTATPAPTPTAETTAAAPPPTNTKPSLAGAASDDSGAGQPKPAGSSPGPIKSPAAPAGAGGSTAAGPTSGTQKKDAVAGNESKPTNATTSAYKYKSSIISNQQIDLASRPGKRLQNPLGDFSSYTYQLTLYMVTPDAYQAFVNSGRKNINTLNSVTGGAGSGGAYIVAQSGGVGPKEKRMVGFDYDYGIDELTIHSLVSHKETSSATQISEVNFRITEPYGFSFLSNLRKAGDALAQYSSGLSKSGYPENPSRQFFVLGIRFYGYDASGRVMTPNVKMAPGEGVVDPTSENGALFEHFLDININQMKFKIDGKTVVYQCEALMANQKAALTPSRGFIKSDTPITAGTVGEAIDQLATKLNTEQEGYAKGTPPTVRYPNRYEIVWLPGTEEIINATLVSPARLEKLRWPTSGATKSSESNAGKEANTQTANNTKKEFQVSKDSPIVQAISDIIKQSSYLEDALIAVYTSDPQADPKTKSQYTQHPSYQKKKVSWFNVTPQVTEIQWDDIVKDWSYKISYLIQKYDTPVVDSPFVQSGKMYPGPHKRYDYWYTGENREIIDYQQTMDNAYITTVVQAVGQPQNDTGGGSQTPKQPGMQSEQPRQGSPGYGLEAQNNFLTALYDVGAYAEAKITIMGDPDWLPISAVYSGDQTLYDQYYGANRYGIGTEGGQVFIEVDFKEAVDYTSQTGTMKINDSILFWKYPETMDPKIKGVSYMVREIDSTFSNGSFKQTLHCNLNHFGTPESIAAQQKEIADYNANVDALKQNATPTGPTPGDGTSTSNQTSGLTPEPSTAPPAPQGTTPPPPKTDPAAQPTTQTKNGPVANDDGIKK